MGLIWLVNCSLLTFATDKRIIVMAAIPDVASYEERTLEQMRALKTLSSSLPCLT